MSDPRAEYARRGLDRMSDAQLAGEIAAMVSVPREAPADSFVLHAPLELVTRTALLPFVWPEHRDAARVRMFAIATELDRSGPPVAEPDAADPDAAEWNSLGQAAQQLVGALDRGELDDVDRVARWLGRAATGISLRSLLTAAVIPRLGAAAHAPIFLFQLPRVAPKRELTGELVRGLARELAREPEWRLHWIDEPRGDDVAGPDELFAAIASTPRAARDGATPFIFPVMAGVDTTGIAATQLAAVTGGDDIAPRAPAVLRAAAWSMLLEPDEHAAYGWSHCLTMPQAVLGIADSATHPSTALAIAATYVVGFRSALAVNPLEPTFSPTDPGLAVGEAIDTSPTLAAASAWHCSQHMRAELVTELATRAALRRDAHLAKYTLACFDAAAADPTHARLYLAAAASLHGWWAMRVDVDDPLGS